MTRRDVFLSEEEFTLRWPAEIVAAELERYVRRAEFDGESQEWRDEVELLLSQAFASAAPVADFARQHIRRSTTPQPDPIYGDEEPF